MSEPKPHLHIEFFIDAVENPRLSLAEGRPIFEDVEMIRIKFVGDNKKELVAPANATSVRDRDSNRWLTYKERFPKHYEAFRAGEAMHADGTPLNELPFLTQSKRAELRALNIHTAEAIEQLDGTLLARLGMGGRALKDQVTAWLSKARGASLETKLAGENAGLRQQMEAMQAQLAELMRGAGATPAPSTARDAAASPFDQWADEDIKAWLKDATGSAPRGNPSHQTLVRMADDTNATMKAKQAA